MPDDSRRIQVWKLITETQCQAYKVQKAGNGFAVIAGDDMVEKLTQPTPKARFMADGFEIFDPPELNAKRTLVVTQADAHVLGQSAEDIKKELERTKQGVKVVEVIKLPNAKTVFKVKLENSAMVKRCTNEGILLFSQSFPQRNLSSDVFVSLDQCMRCYDYTHVKKNCPKPDTYKICSNCSSLHM